MLGDFNTTIPEYDISFAERLIHPVARLSNGRKLIRLSPHAVGMASAYVEVGDRVCVVLGCSVPIIFHREGDHFLNLGDTFIDGFMNGEATDGISDGKYKLQTFELH